MKNTSDEEYLKYLWSKKITTEQNKKFKKEVAADFNQNYSLHLKQSMDLLRIISINLRNAEEHELASTAIQAAETIEELQNKVSKLGEKDE